MLWRKPRANAPFGPSISVTLPTMARQNGICRLVSRPVGRRIGRVVSAPAFGPSWFPRSLPGLPAEHSPAQHVQMDVVHRLAGACIHVEHSAVAFFVDIRLHSKFLGNLKHLPDQRAVLRLQIIQCRNVLLGHDQEMNGSLRPKILKGYDEVVLMHKVRGCFVFDDSAKKARMLHGFNLALLGVILCTTLLAGTSILQSPAPTDSSPVNRTELLSCEGQTVSSVEVAGRPDISIEEFTRVPAQPAREPFSSAKIEQSVLALQHTGQFQDVQVDLRPGIYQFPGGGAISICATASGFDLRVARTLFFNRYPKGPGCAHQIFAAQRILRSPGATADSTRQNQRTGECRFQDHA